MEWASVRRRYQKEPKLDDEAEEVDNDEVQNGYEPLILRKQLGHPEIHNSKHWKISNECWMCDKWRYTYIFWNVHTGHKY